VKRSQERWTEDFDQIGGLEIGQLLGKPLRRLLTDPARTTLPPGQIRAREPRPVRELLLCEPSSVARLAQSPATLTLIFRSPRHAT